MDKLKGNANIGVNVTLVANGRVTLGSEAHSVYRIECYKRNGKLRWKEEIPNVVFDVGKAHLLNVGFNALAQDTWYVGLVDSSGFTGFVAGDTIASHGGWVENTAYTGANRLTWTASGAATTGTIDNLPGVSFNFTTTETIRGAFLVGGTAGGGQIKGGVTGFLYGAAQFGAPRSVFNGDILRVTVTMTL